MHAAQKTCTQKTCVRMQHAGLENARVGHGGMPDLARRAALAMLALLAILAAPVGPVGPVGFVRSAMALDDIANLKGMGVVAAGQVKRLDCPLSGRFDCNSWPTNFLKFEYENICFAADPGVCGAYCKGILATDKGKTVYFFESLPGGDLSQRRARGYECPPGF